MRILFIAVACAALTFAVQPADAQTFDFETPVTWDTGENGNAVDESLSSETPLQAGNHLKWDKVAGGVSAASVLVTAVDTNSTYGVSVYMRNEPSGSFWHEFGWNLGIQSATDFNTNPPDWGDDFAKLTTATANWVQFSDTIADTGSNSNVSLGFKLGGNAGTVGRWDTVLLQKVGDPPTASISNGPSGTAAGEVTFDYTLTDDDDADADADINIDYAVQEEFDTGTLDLGVQWGWVSETTDFEFVTSPSALRLRGSPATQSTFAAGDISVPRLYHVFYGAGDFTLDIDISNIVNDASGADEGVGIFVSPANQTDPSVFHFAQLKYDGLSTDLEVEWNAVGSSGGLSAQDNVTVAPTAGTPVRIRVQRSGDDLVTRWAENNGSLSALGAGSPFNGTDMASGSPVWVGLFITTPTVGGAPDFYADIDRATFNFQPATAGAAGDGLTGLASTSTGDAHTVSWNTSVDVPVRLDNVVFRITPSDDDGTGAADTFGPFSISNLNITNVERWSQYR